MIETFMRFRGNTPQDGAALATAVKAEIRLRFKKDRQKITSHQIEQIKREFNGQNQQLIMERYSISRATLYRYLHK